jgi:hypothetical protein
MELAFDTTNLLRPHQVQEAKEDLASLNATLNAPPHIRTRISDMGELRRRRDNLTRELEKSSPKPFSPQERDAAIREFRKLEHTIREGMPSSEEMRRNPPGAVGKQLTWDKAKSQFVMRYKHLALRLHAGGDLPHNMRFEGDIANIERLRPLTTRDQVSMDGAQIPKQTDYHFGDDIANAVTLSDDEINVVTEIDPEIAGKLALMTPEQRAIVKKHVDAILNPKPEAPKSSHKDNGWTRMQKLAKRHGVLTFGRLKKDILADLAAKGVEVT